MTTRWTGNGRSTSSSARVSMSCLIDLTAAAQPSPSVAMWHPWSPLNVCGSQRAKPHSAPLSSRVSTQMRSSVGECVAASDSTSPRAAAWARAWGPTRASDPVVSRFVSSGVPHCSVSSSSSGSSATIADASGARPTHTDVKSASLGLRSHSRRWRASACSAAMPAHAAEWRRRARSSRRRAVTLARNSASSAAYSAARCWRLRSVFFLRFIESAAMRIGASAITARKIQRPVMAAMPTPVISGSSARHQLDRLLCESTSVGRGASTREGSADWAVRNWRAKTRSAARRPSTASSRWSMSTTVNTELPAWT